MKWVNKFYEFVYGDGNYDHVLTFSGLVDNERYNVELRQRATLIDIVIIFITCAIGALMI